MTFKEFNALQSREKWSHFKKVKARWCCPSCGEEDSIDPRRCSPFPGASIHCGSCDHELTRRTGGGQCDPFNWVPKKKKVQKPKAQSTRKKWSDCKRCPECGGKKLYHKYANCLCHRADEGPTCWTYPICLTCGFTIGSSAANSCGGGWTSFIDRDDPHRGYKVCEEDLEKYRADSY